jgi:hypothetical protein
MQAKFEEMTRVLPTEGIVTTAEAALVVCAGYSVHVWRQHSHAVHAVEDMLMEQLIAAIGKRIGPADFAKRVVGLVFGAVMCCPPSLCG